MQAQRAGAQELDTALISETRSEVAVKTLVTAGIGCLTYLRGLLPDDNFENAHLSSLTVSPKDAEGARSKAEGKSRSGVRIKVIKRGYSTEGDQMLDYLERGIFDALEKHYLKSFILAVYLDKEDPSNIIESWTFNFRYPRDPVSGQTDAALSIDNRLASMSLGGPMDFEPGRGVTIGEVKSNLKSLTKAIISATQGMDQLPGRRFATFKLFYNDETPDDYEPPLFVPADVVKDKFMFATHNAEEPPETVRIGSLATDHHAVAVTITSIAAMIPNGEDNAAAFSGLANGKSFEGAMQLNDLQFADQMKDAQSRTILWDADIEAAHVPGSEDAEGEPDITLHDGAALGLPPTPKPIAMRDSDGVLRPWVPVPPKPVVVKSKRQENRSINFNSQTSTQIMNRLPSEGEPTQPIFTQTTIAHHSPKKSERVAVVDKENFATPKKAHNAARTPFSDSSLTPISINTHSPLTSFNAVQQTNMSSIAGSHGIDTQELKIALSGQRRRQQDQSMDDSIETFGDSSQTVDAGAGERMDEDVIVMDSQFTQLTPKSKKVQIAERVQDENDSSADKDVELGMGMMDTQMTGGMEEMETQLDILDTQAPMDTQMTEREQDAVCVCGSTGEETDWIHCNSCDEWFHTSCMGYHSGDDPRIPDGDFRCFSCQLAADPNSTLFSSLTMDAIQLEWSELTLFRRALKAVSDGDAADRPDNQTALKKQLGVETRVAGQLWKRLEAEGFIAPESERLNPFDSKKKGPKPRGRKPNKRVFVNTRETRQKLKTYFEPRGGVEADIVRAHFQRSGSMKRSTRNSQSQSQSQSQGKHDVPETLAHSNAVPDQPPTPSHTRIVHGPIVPLPQTPTTTIAGPMEVVETPNMGAGEKRKEPASGFASRATTAKRQKISLAAYPMDLSEE